jgi:hypothetical protein
MRFFLRAGFEIIEYRKYAPAIFRCQREIIEYRMRRKGDNRTVPLSPGCGK